MKESPKTAQRRRKQIKRPAGDRRNPYEKPRVRKYGSISEFTRGGNAGGGEGGLSLITNGGWAEPERGPGQWETIPTGNVFRSVALVITRRCPLSCGHCITASSPRESARMRLSQATRYLKGISRFTKAVSFTGGEPLLHPRELLSLISCARHLGLKTAVVTGLGWAKTSGMMRRRLSELKGAGLDRITVSWDAYHEQSASADRALSMTRLAVEAGLEVRVTVVRCSELELNSYTQLFAGLPDVRLQPSRLIRLGSAENLPDSHFQWHSEPIAGPCSSVSNALIDTDGTVYACCGPSLYSRSGSPLILGNAEQEPLSEILSRASRNVILQAISLIGPYGLLRLLQQHPGDEQPDRRSRYSSICDLCLDITSSSSLVTTLRERLGEPDARALLAAALMQRRAQEPAAADVRAAEYRP